MTDEFFDISSEAAALRSGHAFGRELRKALERMVEKRITEQIGALANRLTALEQRAGQGMRFCGIFSRAEDYTRGSVCVYNGTLWFCCRDNIGITPGTTDDWLLMLKHQPAPAPRLREAK